MAKKTVFAVGIELPDVEGFEAFDMMSDQSLLDADIIAFRPTFADFYSDEKYQGKRVLSEGHSARVAEQFSHWRRQLKTAIESGKTAVLYLPEKQEIFRYTGQSKQSGTGRNTQITKMVTPISNYEAMPLAFDEVTIGSGKSMRLAASAEIISSYWRDYGPISTYQVFFALEGSVPLVVTSRGQKIVGAKVKARAGGNVIILPDLKWRDINLYSEEEKGEEEQSNFTDYYNWSEEAKKFAFNFRDTLLTIDANLLQGKEETPEPDWAGASSYRLQIESQIEEKLIELTQSIEEQVAARENKRNELKQHASIRRLLYEKGALLESAVRDTLNLMGFDAKSFKDSESEFDALFTGLEGRFIGEVEGKDNKAINVDKFSQLERNIHEDFAKDDVEDMAHGILFGNAYRVSPPSDRAEFFTDKVFRAAKRAGVGLVRTTDLFEVARYLKEHDDPEYAKKCREAIATAKGKLVKFPAALRAKKPTVGTS